MGDRLTRTEIAAALLIEARAAAAQRATAETWPRRQGPISPADALASAWTTFPDQTVRGREGFALARRALERASTQAPHEEAIADDMVELIDRALSELRFTAG